jgi:hypothetical protein
MLDLPSGEGLWSMALVSLLIRHLKATEKYTLYVTLYVALF